MNISMWKKIRIDKGLTQEEVAKHLGISTQAISSYETGKRPMPKKLQIYYLELRNSKEDKTIIKYLKGE